MKPSIAHMRAAGLSDQQIVAVLEETERDQRERWRKQKQFQRSCPQDTVDMGSFTYSSSSTSIPVEEERKKVSERMLSIVSSGQCGQQFDEFWELYPNKVGKPAARKAFTTAILKVTLSDLIVGVRRYMVHKPADRQWLNPATFLNQERWADQPAKVESNGNGRDDSKSATAAARRLQEQLESEGGVGYVPGSGGPRLLPQG